ncbi:Amino acid transporter [Macleaya cordata]|uniref:Amino acid transporter n=1 Tax=Macleaya cordata TaxID=56857 RepID=A0A200R519_MACCD|nr:Amino acid transporter [Macleaya cordata]
MKQPDDETGRDRAFEFETDDEENQAEGGNEDDYDTDYTTTSSPNPSECSLSHSYGAWPQSYRQSMDMYTSVTPPTVGFLAGSSLGTSFGISSSFLSSSIHKRHQASEQSLNKPFISITTLDKEAAPPTPASKHSSRRFSYHELPPTQECSYAQSVLNGVNVLCGVGLLSTPYAIKQGGWIGLLVLLAFGVISCYTGILLKRCLDSSPGLQTYPDIGQAAFGAAGRLAIACCCVEYIILMGDNLSSLFPNVYMNFAGIHLNSHYFFTITTTLLVLPTVWLRNLSLLSYLSAGGVVASLLVVLCLLWVGVIDHIGFHPSGTSLDLTNLPVAIGLYGFCYAGHSVFPNIYSSMKQPSKFPAALMTSFLICCFLYTGVAICGFMMFGEATQSQFTLNMPQKFVASRIAVWTTVVNPLSKYALTITPVALSLEELLPSAHQKSHSVSVLIRTILVLSTLAVALTIPFFGKKLFHSSLPYRLNISAFILPCACYLSILRGRLSSIEIASCIFILMAGVACSFIGSYSAITKIAEKMG